MFGDRYFATRQRFTDVVTRVRELGEECETDVEALVDDSDYLKELRRPFLVVFCGETNCGKSTLINALFGTELCEVSERPNTEKIIRYQWGEKERTEEKETGGKGEIRKGRSRKGAITTGKERTKAKAKGTGTIAT